MAVLSNTMMQGTAAFEEDTGFKIEKSLRFNAPDAPSMKMVTSGQGNRRTFTIAWWQKITFIDEVIDIWTGGATTGHGVIIRGNYDTNGNAPEEGKIFIGEYNSSWDWYFYTDRAIRDPGAWQHFCVAFDSTQATNTERVKLYINGKQETSLNVNSWPSQNHEFAWNTSGKPIAIGGLWNNAVAVEFDGYIADAYHIDGLALTPAAFGSFDSTGVWNPKNTYDDDGKFILPAPNDGRTWSTGGEAGSFDGSLSNGPLIGTSYTTICTDLDVTVNQGLRIEGNWAGASATLTIELDGVEYKPTSTVGLWETFDQFAGKSISGILKAKTSSGSAYLRAVEVDGVILVDGQTDPTIWNEKWTEYFATAKSLLDCTASSCDDISDGNHNTTDGGSPTYDAAPGTNSLGVTECISLDGSDDHLVPVNADLSISSSTETTIDIIFYLDSTHNIDEGYLYDFRSTGDGYCMYMWASNKIGIKGASYGEITSVTEDTWHHLRIQSDKVWLDGVDKGIAPGKTAIGSVVSGKRYQTYNGNWFHFKGLIGAFRILDYKLGVAPPAGGEVCVNGVLAKIPSTENDEVNSFHLKFNDVSSNAALGTDSFNDNDFTVTNLTHDDGTAESTLLSAATGGLPIYNTTGNYGGTKGSGYRDDNKPDGSTSVESSIVLAIAGDGITDEHDEVKGSGSAKTITNNSSNVTVVDDSGIYYGKALQFGSSNHYLNLSAGSGSDFDFGTGDHTMECWLYSDGGMSSSGHFFSMWEGGGTLAMYCSDDSTQKLRYTLKGTTGGEVSIQSPTYPLNEWFHFAAVRDGNTMRLFINGEQKGTATFSVTCAVCSNFTIGRMSDNGAAHWKGKIAGIRVYKGVAKYGAAGFDIFKDAVDPAKLDSLVDTPTNYGTDTGAGATVRGNYCNWNPLEWVNLAGGGGTLTTSNGNLKVYQNADGNKQIYGTMGVSSGKWYYEVELTAGTTDWFTLVGWRNENGYPTYYHSTDANGWSIRNTDGKKMTNDTYTAYATGAGDSTACFLMAAIDVDAKKCWFGINGTWGDSGNPATAANPAYSSMGGTVFRPALSQYYSATTSSANFGQRAFKYTAPSGFKALCSTNLPNTFSGDELNNPSKYFDVKTYTGTGASRDIKGVGFGPDLIWVKERGGVNDHQVYDAIRGTGKRLRTNTNDSQATQTGGVNAFLSDGWTQGDAGTMNNSGDTYVGWLWDAGTAVASTSNGGDATNYTRWTNATAGFSIIKCDHGISAAETTADHGLGVPPDFIISKNPVETETWHVFHSALGVGSVGYLDTDAAWRTDDNHKISAVSNSQITLKNYSSDPSTLHFVWTAIPGYSAFGSYGGNSSTDGTFIYTGFKVKYLLIKRTDSTSPWTIFDSARGENENNVVLEANADSAEATPANRQVDLLSNGFKNRATSGNTNTTGGTYIYAALAEHPFKTARAK